MRDWAIGVVIGLLLGTAIATISLQALSLRGRVTKLEALTQELGRNDQTIAATIRRLHPQQIGGPGSAVGEGQGEANQGEAQNRQAEHPQTSP